MHVGNGKRGLGRSSPRPSWRSASRLALSPRRGGYSVRRPPLATSSLNRSAPPPPLPEAERPVALGSLSVVACSRVVPDHAGAGSSGRPNHYLRPRGISPVRHVPTRPALMSTEPSSRPRIIFPVTSGNPTATHPVLFRSINCAISTRCVLVSFLPVFAQERFDSPVSAGQLGVGQGFALRIMQFHPRPGLQQQAHDIFVSQP